MDTGELTLDQKTIKEIRKEVLSPSEEDIKLDEKYTMIQTITNIFCAVMRFDEEKHDKYINYIFEDGKVWIYTDYDGIISKDYLTNIILKMPSIDDDLVLEFSEITPEKVTKIGEISFGKSGVKKSLVRNFQKNEVKNVIFFIEKMGNRIFSHAHEK